MLVQLIVRVSQDQKGGLELSDPKSAEFARLQQTVCDEVSARAAGRGPPSEAPARERNGPSNKIFDHTTSHSGVQSMDSLSA